MKLNFRKVCLFWGMMDIFYIGRFIWLNAEQGRIPLIDDVISFNHIYPEYSGGEWMVVLFFTLSIMLNVSVVFSAIFLIAGWRKVRYFVFAQIPFRLLFIIPSISFTPWLLKQLHASSIAVLITVLVFSEILKVVSFYFTKSSGGLSVVKNNHE